MDSLIVLFLWALLGLSLLIFIVFIIALIIGCWLIYSGTKKKTKWGININPIVCPKCGGQLPQVRKPKNRQQALWGGGTCEQCNIDLDKWGRPISSR